MSAQDDRDDLDDYDSEDEEADENDIQRREDLKRLNKAKQAIVDVRKQSKAEPLEERSKDAREDVEEIIREHREVATQPSYYGTLLHGIVELVKNEEVKSPDVKLLVERLVQDCPDLLRYPNSEGQNALHMAISHKKYKLVDYMLASCSDARCLTEALEMPCGKMEASQTVLHLAFEKDLRASTTQRLVELASEKLLSAKDGSGQTPFHYAVKYSQCSDERVKIIKLLIEKDVEAVAKQRKADAFRPLNTFLDQTYNAKKDEINISVYREHLRTADLYKRERKPPKSVAGDGDPAKAEDNPQGITIPIRSDPKATARQKESKHQPERERERGGLRIDRDRDRGKQDLGVQDDLERRRQLAKEEERLAKERELRRKVGQDAELNGARSKHVTGVRERQEDVQYEASRIETSNVKLSTEPAPNTPIKRVSSFRPEVPEEKKRKERRVKEPRNLAKKPDVQTLASNSEQILHLLKLHYMRTRGIKMTTFFLYGKNVEDIQICFDYEGLPLQIKDHVFMERFGSDNTEGIRFDNVLMYVRFTNVTVVRSGRKAASSNSLGRQDMEFFMQWLYSKGVRRILKLEVDDSRKSVHSDESIQKSLEKIVVEHLDWQKVDLDPRTICQISNKVEMKIPTKDEPNRMELSPGNQLKELTLRWSGRNAVLRAWSEPEGLPLLAELKTVNLHIPPPTDTYDSLLWIQNNVEEFERRLNQNANFVVNKATSATIDDEADVHKANTGEKISDTITIPHSQRSISLVRIHGAKGKIPKAPSTETSKLSESSKPITEHEWLRCMERFAGAESMPKFWDETRTRFQECLKKEQGDDNRLAVGGLGIPIEKDVVVALIDDGVDSCDPAFAGRVIEGKTFDYQDGSVGQYYISAGGHGTNMAKMILKVCPMAKIYSIRLETHTASDKEDSTIDSISAALAIEAALEKNATIISMSWTVPVPKDGSPEKRLWDTVLEKACKRNVLMFCSSSDQIQSNKHYPTAFNRDKFFLIGAAHDDGTPYGHAGKDIDFIFPGVNVNTSGGGDLPSYLADKTTQAREATGSSIATALAAGFAATIIYCFKALALATVTVRVLQGRDYITGPQIIIKPEYVRRIAEHDVMKIAFNKVGDVDNGRFIQVWTRFNRAIQVLEDKGKNYDDRVKSIMTLCSDLIQHES